MLGSRRSGSPESGLEVEPIYIAFRKSKTHITIVYKFHNHKSQTAAKFDIIPASFIWSSLPEALVPLPFHDAVSLRCLPIQWTCRNLDFLAHGTLGTRRMSRNRNGHNNRHKGFHAMCIASSSWNDNSMSIRMEHQSQMLLMCIELHLHHMMWILCQQSLQSARM
jgi:hypothetical protein